MSPATSEPDAGSEDRKSGAAEQNFKALKFILTDIRSSQDAFLSQLDEFELNKLYVMLKRATMKEPDSDNDRLYRQIMQGLPPRTITLRGLKQTGQDLLDMGTRLIEQTQSTRAIQDAQLLAEVDSTHPTTECSEQYVTEEPNEDIRPDRPSASAYIFPSPAWGERWTGIIGVPRRSGAHLNITCPEQGSFHAGLTDRERIQIHKRVYEVSEDIENLKIDLGSAWVNGFTSLQADLKELQRLRKCPTKLEIITFPNLITEDTVFYGSMNRPSPSPANLGGIVSLSRDYFSHMQSGPLHTKRSWLIIDCSASSLPSAAILDSLFPASALLPP